LNARQFWNGSNYEITKYGFRVIFSDIILLLNFMKIYHLFHNLLRKEHTGRQTDGQPGGLMRHGLLLRKGG
jgi:hypothetical protein